MAALADSGLNDLQECASQGDAQCSRELKAEIKSRNGGPTETLSSQIHAKISSIIIYLKIFFKHPFVIWNFPPLLLFVTLLAYSLRVFDGDLLKEIHTPLIVAAFLGVIVGSLTLFIVKKLAFIGAVLALPVGLICVACITLADAMLLCAFAAKPQLRKALQKWGVVLGIFGVTPIFTFFLGVALIS